MKIKRNLIINIFLICLFTSCQKWLGITPSDQFSSEDLFASENGYIKGLNGIYLEMNDKSSYGEYLSCGPIDVLAHYYHINPRTHNHRYNTISEFKYDETSSKEIFSSIWSKSFALIANSNALLEKIPESPSNKLTDPLYSFIKGEALGLRAFLHFDILRLYGPVGQLSSNEQNVLPYAFNSSSEVHALVTKQQYVDYIINDLLQALELLKNDPIRSEGTRHQESPTGDNFFYYRQYRMNYFAVKSILVRVYLYKKEYIKANELAKEIIKETKIGNKDIFPFVSKSSATDVVMPDRMFSTEVIFSLYNTKRAVLYNDIFSSILPSTMKLSFNLDNTSTARVAELYDDENDFRRSVWQLRTDNSRTTLTNMKYEFIATAPGRFMIPLIRISELYLIVAETSLSLNEGTAYLNIVRKSRNCIDLYPSNKESLLSAINNEYRKEFMGEGQMFFFLKRTETTIIPKTDQLTGTETMFLSNYTVPLPDNEISIRKH